MTDSEAIFYRVERHLRRCSRSRSKIRSLQFECCFNKSYSNRFQKCMYSLGRLGVEELVYCSCCGNFLRRSSDCDLLSKMPSLKYFQLAFCSLQPNMKSQCNSLQVLSLMNVTMLPGALECILSNCLRLDSLTVDHCDCPSKLSFRGSNLPLKSLMIQDCEGLEEIELYASNLIKFEFHSPELVNFIFDHLPQLQKICLSLEKENIMFYVFEELAENLPCLRSLALSTLGDFDQGSKRHMGMGIETFSNLRRLELKLVYHTPQINLPALTPFLESCPHLQEFHLDIPVLHDGAKVQPRKQMIHRSQVVVLHVKLTKVEISGFSGTENEMDFVLYILKSAVNLEQMHIIWRTRYNYKMRGISPRHKMIEQQLKRHALSTAAQVIIKYAF